MLIERDCAASCDADGDRAACSFSLHGRHFPCQEYFAGFRPLRTGFDASLPTTETGHPRGARAYGLPDLARDLISQPGHLRCTAVKLSSRLQVPSCLPSRWKPDPLRPRVRGQQRGGGFARGRDVQPAAIRPKRRGAMPGIRVSCAPPREPANGQPLAGSREGPGA